MTLPVVSLNGRRIIEVLREALDDAEAGRLTSVAIIYETKEQTGHRVAFGQRDFSCVRLVGALHFAAAAIIAAKERDGD